LIEVKPENIVRYGGS